MLLQETRKRPRATWGAFTFQGEGEGKAGRAGEGKETAAWIAGQGRRSKDRVAIGDQKWWQGH